MTNGSQVDCLSTASVDTLVDALLCREGSGFPNLALGFRSPDNHKNMEDRVCNLSVSFDIMRMSLDRLSPRSVDTLRAPSCVGKEVAFQCSSCDALMTWNTSA